MEVYNHDVDTTSSMSLTFDRSAKFDELYEKYILPSLKRNRKYFVERGYCTRYAVGEKNDEYNRACLRAHFRSSIFSGTNSDDPAPNSVIYNTHHFNRAFYETAQHFGFDVTLD